MTDKKLIEAVKFILKNPSWENRANLEILLEGVDIAAIAAAICKPVALAAHKGQPFKSSNDTIGLDDYTNYHLAVVARLCDTRYDFPNAYDHLVTLCAAWLHDIVEDTSLTLNDIREEFGTDVGYIVDKLTKDLTDHMTNIKLYSFVPAVAQIKLADIYRNAETIGFAKNRAASQRWALKKLEQIRHFYQPDQEFVEIVTNKLREYVGY